MIKKDTKKNDSKKNTFLFITKLPFFLIILKKKKLPIIIINKLIA